MKPSRVKFASGDDSGEQYGTKSMDVLPPDIAAHGTPPERSSSNSSLQKAGHTLGKRPSTNGIVDQLEKLRETEGVSSIDRETRNFVSITSMHGVLRTYKSHGWRALFWAVLLSISACLLLWQIILVIIGYAEQPTLSQVSFLISEEQGIAFPKVTICNLNPIRKSYISKMNMTGELSSRVLGYIMESNNDVTYGYANEGALKQDDDALKELMQKHPNFTIPGFFHDAGFECKDIMKLCYFAGREFDCCQYATSVLTTIGQCQMLNFQASQYEWMKKQTQAGVSSGLQVILDVHLEEQIEGTGIEPEPVFSTSIENGFQFFVDDADLGTFVSSQAISLSPGHRVYSALTSNKYTLLDKNQWGNCTSIWPAGYTGRNTQLKYSSTDCISKCKAKFFHTQCGCSPIVYNIDDEYPNCTPYQTVICMKENIIVKYNETYEEFQWPPCTECSAECEKREYIAYNSYGEGFSKSAVRWLQARNSSWTEERIRNNFLTINVFFRDLTYIEYSQVQGTSFSQMISNIGGNMGMFLGMSVFTVFESVIYLAQLSWVMISKRRREHLVNKKKAEEARQSEMEETAKTLHELSSSHRLSQLVAVTAQLSMANQMKTWGSERDLECGLPDAERGSSSASNTSSECGRVITPTEGHAHQRMSEVSPSSSPNTTITIINEKEVK